MLTKNGQPITLYHGTAAEFDVFRPLSHFGTRRAAETILRSSGNHIKPDLLSYSDKTSAVSGRAHLIPVQLNMSHPLPLSDMGHTLKGYKNTLFKLMLARQLGVDSPILYARQLAAEQGLDAEKVFFKLCRQATFMAQHRFIFNDPLTLPAAAVHRELWFGHLYPLTNDDTQNRENLIVQRMVRYLESLGYDGISYINDLEDVGSLSYIIFRPKQVVRLDKDVVNRLPLCLPENAAVLDRIQSERLPHIDSNPLTKMDCISVYQTEVYFHADSFLGKPHNSERYWQQFAVEKVVPLVSSCRQTELEQRMEMGIAAAVQADVRPMDVIVAYATHMQTQTLSDEDFIETLPLFLENTDFDLTDTERAQIGTAVMRLRDDIPATNALETCLWRAVRPKTRVGAQGVERYVAERGCVKC